MIHLTNVLILNLKLIFFDPSAPSSFSFAQLNALGRDPSRWTQRPWQCAVELLQQSQNAGMQYNEAKEVKSQATGAMKKKGQNGCLGYVK